MFTSRWSVKAAALKTLGAAAALAVGASTLVVSPAQAVSDDFYVWHTPADYDSAYVCADPSSGDSLSFSGTTTVGIDTDESSSYYDTHADQVTFTSVNNDYCGSDNDLVAYRADGLEPEEEVYFYIANSLVITETNDRAAEGSSYWSDSNGYWSTDWGWSNASLAYSVDYIHDERHTAVICVEPYNNWDGDGSIDELRDYGIRTYNVTTDSYEDLEYFTEDPYWSNDEGYSYQCSSSDDIEFYVTGLTLGDTYQFNVLGVNDYWVDDEGWYIASTYWVSEWTNYFTPLNVHTEQITLFDDNNGGCDGSCEAYDEYWGTDDQAARAWVDAPVNTDGWNFGSAEAWWYLYDNQDDEWSNGWLTASEVGGYWDNTFDDMSGMDGQALMEAYYCECDWTFEGLSDTYIDNMGLDWNLEWSRATSSTSVELVLETNMTTDEWNSDYTDESYDTNQYLDPSTATYYIRAIPNDGGRDYYDGGSFRYEGNNTNRPTRYETIDYVFVPQDQAGEGDLTYTTLGDVDCYWNGFTSVCQDQGAVKFNLTGLQPGTTYDIEYRAVVPVDGAADPVEGDLMDSYWDDAQGDGNYTEVEFRDSAAWFTTTYLATKVDQVTDTSARFLIDVTDSHMNTTNLQKSAINGLYWSLNECTETEGYWDGSVWIDGGTFCNEVWNDYTEDYGTRFDSDHTTSVKVSTDVQNLVAMRDGHLYVPIKVEGLQPNHKYEIVAGMDYWWVNGVETDSWWWSDDYAQEFSYTVDFDSCDTDVIDYEDTDFGADCYNSTTNNNIFRTDVQTFTTSGAPSLEAVQTEVDEASSLTYVDSDLTLHFNKDVQIGEGTIKVVRADNDTVVRTIDVATSPAVVTPVVEVVVDPDTEEETEVVHYDQVKIAAGDDLAYNTTYYLVISAGAFLDVPANGVHATGLAKVRSANFTTVSIAIAPQITGVTVVDGEEDGTDTDTAFAITFSESIALGDGVFEIRRKSDDSVVRSLVPARSPNAAVIDNMLIVSGGKLLDYNTEYYLHLAAGAVKDRKGNNMAAWSDFSFKTEAKPALLGTVKVGASYDMGKREVKLNFGPEMAGQSVKLFWVSRHTDTDRFVRNVTLDKNGDATVVVTVYRMEKLDGVRVKFGRHTIGWHTIKVN